MGGKKDKNYEFSKALQGKQVPLLILDQKWHSLFQNGGKPRNIVRLEKKENELLRRQGRLNEDAKELKGLKNKLMKAILFSASGEAQGAKEEKKLQEDRRLLIETKERLCQILAEQEELPGKLNEVNEALMTATMEHFHEIMSRNEMEIEMIGKWLEQMREEARQKAARKQTAEDMNREIYSYMHDILGADVIEIFDLKYAKEASEDSEENKKEEQS